MKQNIGSFITRGDSFEQKLDEGSGKLFDISKDN